MKILKIHIFIVLALMVGLTTTQVNAMTNLIDGEADTEAVTETEVVEEESVETVEEPVDDTPLSVAIPDLPILTLEVAIEKALENNRNIELAEEAIKSAELNGIYNYAQLFPILSWSTSYTRLADMDSDEEPGDGGPSFSSPNSCYSGISLTYRLYSGGERQAYERQIAADMDLNEAQMEVMVAMIAYAATDAFCTAREGLGGLAVRQASFEHLLELERQAQALFDAGYMPLSDLLMVQVARSRAEVQVLEWQNNVQTRQSALNLILGEDVASRWTLVPIEYPIVEIPFDLETLIEWAMENRPELRQLDAERERIHSQIDLVHAGLRPKVDFTAEYSHADDSFSFNNQTDNLSAGFMMYWILFDFGLSQDVLDPLEQQLDMIDIREAELREQIRTEVEAAVLSVNTQLENVTVTGQAVVQAEEALRVSTRRMEEGLGLMVEVLDAEATWTELGAGSVFSTHMYYRLLAALSGAVGVNPLDMIALIEVSGGIE